MKRILLEAPIYTNSGYGEHSRLVFRSLLGQDNIEILIRPLNWGATSWSLHLQDEDFKEKIEKCILNFSNYIEECKQKNVDLYFDKQIFVGILNEFEKKAQDSIVVTAGIETDRISAQWVTKANQGVNKIIVPSEHAKYVFDRTSYEIIDDSNNTKKRIECNPPVKVVPYPVKDTLVKDLDFTLKTKFNFLSIAQLGPRKNIINMIKWFIEEFRNEDVGLVLKTCRATGSNIDKEETLQALRSSIKNTGSCKIYILHGDLKQEEIHSLYKRKDIHAYINLAHGEGFGLPIFEAAYSGMPVIATNWSGHLDFLSADYREGSKIKKKALFAKVDYQLSKIPEDVVWPGVLEQGSLWAFPKEQSYRQQLRKVYNNIGMYRKWATALKKSLQNTHADSVILKQFRDEIFEENLNKKIESTTNEIIL